MSPEPRVGIGVTVLKNGKVLLTKRKGSHGAGDYASPGGHLEFDESFEECARRETREETGIEIKNLRFQFLANVTFPDKQYVHVGLLAEWESGEPTVLEPEKAVGWEWYEPKELPAPLFQTTNLSMVSMKTGQTYFDLG